MYGHGRCADTDGVAAYVFEGTLRIGWESPEREKTETLSEHV